MRVTEKIELVRSYLRVVRYVSGYYYAAFFANGKNTHGLSYAALRCIVTVLS